MITNVLLTGGRAPVTLALARCFDRSGLRVFVAESIPHHLCTRSRAVVKNYLVSSPRFAAVDYIQDLIKIIKSEKIDLLVPTCEEIYYIAQVRDSLSNYCQVFCEGIDKLNLLHNKYLFIKYVRDLHLPAPQTEMITSQSGIQVKFDRVVLKPVYSRFGSQAKIIDRHQIPNLQSLNINQDNPWIIQEFITGEQYCTYTIAQQGNVKITAIYPVTFTASDGACIYYQAIEYPDLQEWIKIVVKQFDFTGQIAFDIIIDANGTIYPIECNPRATSGLCLIQPQLVNAILDNSQLLETNHPEDRSYMLLLAMLIYGLPAAIRQHQFKQYWHSLVKAKDLLWEVGDWQPWMSAMLMVGYFQQMSNLHSIGLTAATTFDIEWNGEKIIKDLGSLYI